MKNKLRRIAAMLLSLIMTISMVGGNVLTVVALDETYAETEMETVVETKTETVAVKETGKNETTETEVETDSEKVEETQPESREEITSYGVNFNVYENSTAKVYVNGQEVTYMVTNEGKVTFIVEPENQFEVNVDKTISANPNFNIQKTARTDVNEFEVSGFSNDITVNIYTQKIPETESEEPPSEENKESESETQRIETSETKESESENTEKTYELTIQHVLETNIGLYADERTITLTDADLSMVFMIFQNRFITEKEFIQHRPEASPEKILIPKTEGMRKLHTLWLKDGKLFQRDRFLPGQFSSELLMMLKSYRQDSFL